MVTDEKVSDSSQFDGVLYELASKLVEELEYLASLVNSNDQQNSIEIDLEKISTLLNNFNDSLVNIKNRPLKALIIHDTKELLNSFKSALALIPRGGLKDESVKSLIMSSTQRLNYFLKLILLSLYVPGTNGNLQILGIRDIFLSLCDTCSPVDNGYSFVSKYYSTKESSGKEMRINTNTLGIIVNEQPSVVFALHTVLLNMTEFGATNVRIEVVEKQVYNIINIYDDIKIDGKENHAVVRDIQGKINAEPLINLGTKDLISKGGLRLSRLLLNSEGCTLLCDLSQEMSKKFSIVVPKGNFVIRLESYEELEI